MRYKAQVVLLVLQSQQMEQIHKACAFQMTPTGVQTIANQTDTTFYFGAAGIDTHSITDLSNNRVVITTATAGLWFLSFVYRLDKKVPFRQSATIKKNGNIIEPI